MKKAITRRRLAAVLACALAAAIVVSGAYAVVLLNQFDTNEFGGKGLRYDATLNEEFLEEKDWNVDDPPVDKLISVTNTGLNDGHFGEVYVRLQLKEYMETFQLEYLYWAIGADGKPVKVSAPGGSKAGNPALFMTYTTDGGVTGQPGIELEDHQAHLIIDVSESATEEQIITRAQQQYGDLEDLDANIFTNRNFVYLTDAVSGKSGWFIQTRAGDINGQYGKWVVAEFARDAKTAKPLDKDTSKAVGHDHGNYDQSKARPSECDYTPYISEPDMEGYDKTDLYREWVKWNFDSNLQLLSEWNSTDQCWLYDDMTDDGMGWFYWSHPLTPDAAHATLQKTTEILLRSIELIKQPEGDFYYAIHVDMAAVSKKDIWGDTPEKLGGTDPWKEPSTFLAGEGAKYKTNVTVAPGGSVNFHSALDGEDVTGDTKWKLSLSMTAGGGAGIMPASIVGDAEVGGWTLDEVPNGSKVKVVLTASEEAEDDDKIYVIASHEGCSDVWITVTVKDLSDGTELDIKADPWGEDPPTWNSSPEAEDNEDGILIWLGEGTNVNDDEHWQIYPAVDPEDETAEFPIPGRTDGYLRIKFDDLFVQQGLTASDVKITKIDTENFAGTQAKEGKTLSVEIDGDELVVGYVPTYEEIRDGGRDSYYVSQLKLPVKVTLTRNVTGGQSVDFILNLMFYGAF